MLDKIQKYQSFVTIVRHYGYVNVCDYNKLHGQ